MAVVDFNIYDDNGVLRNWFLDKIRFYDKTGTLLPYKEGDLVIHPNGSKSILGRFDTPTFGVHDDGTNMVFKFNFNNLTLTDKPTVVGLGSSTMANTNTNPPDGYGERIETRLTALGGSFVNLADPGRVSNEMLPTSQGGDPQGNIDAALEYNPDFVIMDEPSNWVMTLTETQQRDNYLSIFNYAYQRGTIVLFNGPRPRNPYTSAQDTRTLAFVNLIKSHPILKYVVNNNHADFVKAATVNDLRTDYDSGDGFHMNAAGTLALENSSWAFWQKFFVPNTLYNQFIIDRSTDNVNWTAFYTISTTTEWQHTFPRQDGWYRVRARYKTGTYTTSNTVRIDPPPSVDTPAVFLATSGTTSPWYNTLNQWGYIYRPAGYDNTGNTTNYPLIIFLHGQGERGTGGNGGGTTGLDLVDNTGLPQLLKGGQLSDCLVWMPQLPVADSTWEGAIVKKAYDYALTKWRVDTNRVYVTGLSLGADGAWNFTKTYPTLPAAIAACSGASYYIDTGSPTDIARVDQAITVPTYLLVGSNDSFLTRLNGYMLRAHTLGTTNVRPKYPVPCRIYKGLGHNSAIWNGKFYQRSTADFDFEKWLLMFSKDATYTARKHVEVVEDLIATNKWEKASVMYTRALSLVNALASSSTKTSYLTRLSTAKSNIASGYGKRYIVSLGATTVPGNIAVVPTNTAGTTATNLKEYYDGTASTKGFTVVTATGSGTGSTQYLDDPYWGMPREVLDTYFNVTDNGGKFKFTGLTTGKTYTINIYGAKDAVYTYATPSAWAELCIIYGTKVYMMDTQYNTENFIQFTATPTSGEIAFDVKGGWTLAAGISATYDKNTGTYSTATTNVTSYVDHGTAAVQAVVLIEP